MTNASTEAPPPVVKDEIWELTTPGRVHVEVINVYGRPQDRSVVGVGARLRISADDRELNEERIRKPELNPFRNGKLRLVQGEQSAMRRGEDTGQMLSDEDLQELFASAKDVEFQTLIDDLGEVNVRRMMSMAKGVDASMSQAEMLRDTIEKRWPLGGDTQVYREMQANPEGFSGVRASS